jgi:hypothetical protein
MLLIEINDTGRAISSLTEQVMHIHAILDLGARPVFENNIRFSSQHSAVLADTVLNA